MTWQATPFAIPLLLSVVFSTGLGLYVLFAERDRDPALRLPFLVMVGFVWLWAAAYTLQLSSTSLAAKLLWNRIVWIGVAGLAVAWPLFVLAYIGYRSWLQPGRIVLLALIPATVLLVVGTVGTVPHVYTNVWLTSVGSTTVLGIDAGPGLIGFIVYSYAVNLSTFGLLAIVALRRQGIYRRQALLLLIAGVLPMAVGVANMANVGSIRPIDPTPATFAVTVLLVAWVLYGYRLFDLAPIAREAVFTELADAVILLDDAGIVIDANDTARDLFGGDRLLGMDRDKAFENYPILREAVEEPQSTKNVTLTIEADGDVRIFSVTTSTVGSAAVAGVVVFLRDVTDREVLQRRFRTLIEQSPNVIAVASPDGSFSYVSPSVERLLGYPPEQLVGDGPIEYVHPDEQHAMAVAIRTTLESGESATVEHRLRHADGTWRRFATTVERLFTGSAKEVVLTSTDVTERRQYEQRLQVLNRVLRHDLKNDVNVIAGYTDLIRDLVDDPDVQSYLDVVDGKASALAHLGDQAREIDVVLHTQSDREEVDLAVLVAQLAEQFAAEYPNADVTMDLPNTAPVVADPLVSSAIDNVLENAVLHHDGPSPTVDVTVEPTAEGFAVVVSDDGPGIPQPEQTVLTTGEETPLEHASGLGLWLVHWIVSESGGELQIEEREPRGTAITMRFSAPSTLD